MYKLNHNIYIVKGAVNACIYDLNKADLYTISLNFADFLLNICMYEHLPETLIKRPSFQQLLQKAIIIKDGMKMSPLITADVPVISNGTIEITQKCNFRCIHCFEGGKICSDMDINNVKYVIDEFESIGISNIHIFGGEPFMHPDICSILYYCKGKFPKISITTNASILNERILDCLLAVRPEILASLHSDLEQEFDKVTGTTGMLGKVKTNIHVMQEKGLDCKIRKVKINGIRSSEIYENYWGDMSGFPIMLGNASISQYSCEMLEAKAIKKSQFSQKLNVSSVLNNMNYQKCFSKNVYVDVNLDVFPCTMERRKKHGNLMHNRLKSIIQEDICRVTKDKIRGCRYCEYRYACDTCFVDTRSSDFYARPWYCLYNPETGVWQDVKEWSQKFQ